MRKLLSAMLPLLALAAPALAADPVWREDATRMYRDGTLRLPWANSLGDWVDADGKALGAKPFASASASASASAASRVRGPIEVRIDVTRLVREHGADFRINSVGGTASLASREAITGQPELRITHGGQTRTLKAVADTEMNTTTYKSLGDRPTLLTQYGVLMRFDQAADPGISRAELVLTTLHRFGDPRLVIFRPVLLSATATVTPGATFEAERPAALRANPRTAAQLKPISDVAQRAVPARVVFSVDGDKIKRRTRSRVVGPTLEAWIEGDDMTAVSDIIALPGARTEAYLTVLLKLADDWTAPGGKLPGLANTGQTGDPCIVGGVPMAPGGWGGRPANACRWSARTGFWGVRTGQIGAGTYFYALSPRDTHGVVDYWSQPLPKGRWVAYVQRVKLNDPGRANGEIAYWLIDRQTAPGGKRVEGAGGIIWRDTDKPQSAINTLWVDVYCGGVACGAAPWPRSTIFLRRLTVTDGLPDLAAIQTEVDRLNARR